MPGTQDAVKWSRLLSTFLSESSEAVRAIDINGNLPKISRRAIKDTLAVVRQEASKIGVLLNGTAEFAHARDVTKEYEQSLAVFVSACRHIAFGSGKTLHQHVRTHVHAVVDASQNLVKAALGGNGNGPTQDLKVLVGMVWDCADRAEKMATVRVKCLFSMT